MGVLEEVSILVVIVLTTLLAVKGVRFLSRYVRGARSRSSMRSMQFAQLRLLAKDGIKDIFHRVVNEEGKVLHSAYQIGPFADGNPVALISDANLFTPLLVESEFSKLPISNAAVKVLIGGGLVVSRGAAWKRQRAALSPLFHLQHLKAMPDIMSRRMKECSVQLANTKGKELSVSQLFSDITLGIVIDCIFGGERYLPLQEMAPLWEAVNQVMPQYAFSEILFGHQMNQWLPLPWNRTMLHSVSRIRQLVYKAIEKRYQDLSTEGEENKDFISTLLYYGGHDPQVRMTTEEICDEALALLFAGHDTSSAVLSWAVTFLADRPHLIDDMRTEISSVLGTRSIHTLGYEDLSQLTLCEQVIRETLRMRPPVPCTDRGVVHDSQIGDHFLPAGSYVYPFFMAAHFDNRYWDEPFNFNPDRFNGDQNSSKHAYFPFSAGARSCIGKRFAMMELVLVLSSLVWQFDISSTMRSEDICWHLVGTLKPVNYTCAFPLHDLREGPTIQ